MTPESHADAGWDSSRSVTLQRPAVGAYQAARRHFLMETIFISIMGRLAGRREEADVRYALTGQEWQ